MSPIFSVPSMSAGRSKLSNIGEERRKGDLEEYFANRKQGSRQHEEQRTACYKTELQNNLQFQETENLLHFGLECGEAASQKENRERSPFSVQPRESIELDLNRKNVFSLSEPNTPVNELYYEQDLEHAGSINSLQSNLDTQCKVPFDTVPTALTDTSKTFFSNTLQFSPRVSFSEDLQSYQSSEIRKSPSPRLELKQPSAARMKSSSSVKVTVAERVGSATRVKVTEVDQKDREISFLEHLSEFPQKKEGYSMNRNELISFDAPNLNHKLSDFQSDRFMSSSETSQNNLTTPLHSQSADLLTEFSEIQQTANDVQLRQENDPYFVDEETLKTLSANYSMVEYSQRPLNSPFGKTMQISAKQHHMPKTIIQPSACTPFGPSSNSTEVERIPQEQNSEHPSHSSCCCSHSEQSFSNTPTPSFATSSVFSKSEQKLAHSSHTELNGTWIQRPVRVDIPEEKEERGVSQNAAVLPPPAVSPFREDGQSLCSDGYVDIERIEGIARQNASSTEFDANNSWKKSKLIKEKPYTRSLRKISFPYQKSAQKITNTTETCSKSPKNFHRSCPDNVNSKKDDVKDCSIFIENESNNKRRTLPLKLSVSLNGLMPKPQTLSHEKLEDTQARPNLSASDCSFQICNKLHEKASSKLQTDIIIEENTHNEEMIASKQPNQRTKDFQNSQQSSRHENSAQCTLRPTKQPYLYKKAGSNVFVPESSLVKSHGDALITNRAKKPKHQQSFTAPMFDKRKTISKIPNKTLHGTETEKPAKKSYKRRNKSTVRHASETSSEDNVISSFSDHNFNHTAGVRKSMCREIELIGHKPDPANIFTYRRFSKQSKNKIPRCLGYNDLPLDSVTITSCALTPESASSADVSIIWNSSCLHQPSYDEVTRGQILSPELASPSQSSLCIKNLISRFEKSSKSCSETSTVFVSACKTSETSGETVTSNETNQINDVKPKPLKENNQHEETMVNNKNTLSSRSFQWKEKILSFLRLHLRNSYSKRSARHCSSPCQLEKVLVKYEKLPKFRSIDHGLSDLTYIFYKILRFCIDSLRATVKEPKERAESKDPPSQFGNVKLLSQVKSVFRKKNEKFMVFISSNILVNRVYFLTKPVLDALFSVFLAPSAGNSFFSKITTFCKDLKDCSLQVGFKDDRDWNLLSGSLESNEASNTMEDSKNVDSTETHCSTIAVQEKMTPRFLSLCWLLKGMQKDTANSNQASNKKYKICCFFARFAMNAVYNVAVMLASLSILWICCSEATLDDLHYDAEYYLHDTLAFSRLSKPRYIP